VLVIPGIGDLATEHVGKKLMPEAQAKGGKSGCEMGLYERRQLDLPGEFIVD
jgi:hypothetical protein